MRGLARVRKSRTAIALQQPASYIVRMDSRSQNVNATPPARPTAILSLGLLLRTARA